MDELEEVKQDVKTLFDFIKEFNGIHISIFDHSKAQHIVKQYEKRLQEIKEKYEL